MGTTHDRSARNSATEELTQRLERAYQQDAIQGFSVAIVNDQGPLYSRGFGFSDAERRIPYTAATTQPIASISKTLIAVALLKAQELGKLDLGDPINKHLPFAIVNPYYPDVPIRVEHLAYHSSSLTDLDAVYARSYVLVDSLLAADEGV